MYKYVCGWCQTQALMHSAQLEAEEPPQSSPSNISFLAWLCAPIPSDLAKPRKLTLKRKSAACQQETAVCGIYLLKIIGTWMGIMVDIVRIIALVKNTGIE